LDASSVPDSAKTWPPSLSITRRASALASASVAAVRLPDAFDDAYTAKPIAATTKRMRTSRTPFMITAYLQEKPIPGRRGQPVGSTGSGP
jgi:hypothetical protein